MRRLFAATLLATACSTPAAVTVETQHAETLGERLSVGATIGIEGAARSDLVLRIDLLAGDEVVRTERDTLPRCAERCVWATTFALDEADPRVTDATVTVEDGGAATSGDTAPLEPEHRIRPDGVEVALGDAAGRLLVVALRSGEPVGGLSLVVRADDERITIPAADLPPHDDVSVRLFPGEGQDAWRS